MTPFGDDEGELRNWLVYYLVTNVGCSPDQIDLDLPLNELGVGSRDAVVLAGELSELLRRPVSPVELWQTPTINSLATALVNPEAESVRPVSGAAISLNEPIAIIGLGCRLPGDTADIQGPGQLWEFLAGRRSAVSTVPDGRWEAFDDGSAATAAALASTTRWGSFLRDVAGFDAEFFGITPREADYIDPQQRLLLEVAVEALEHAGIPAESLQRSLTGVFVGACVSEYGYLASRDLSQVDAWSGTGGALSIIANRLSYFLDLRGPSLAIDTACSSSLVTVHMACQSLRTGQSELAIAGGVNLVLSPTVTRSFDAAEAMSKTGACHSFDAAADGFVRGEGCGVAVLKRLSDAVRDGDRVLAVVRGSAVNQDGRSNGLDGTQPGRPGGGAARGVRRRRGGARPGRLRRDARHRDAAGRPDRSPGPRRRLRTRAATGSPAAGRCREVEPRPSRGGRGHRRAHQGHTGRAGRRRSPPTSTSMLPIRTSRSTNCG